jgi:hypothetical protein
MKTQDKIDLCKMHSQEYSSPKKPVFIDVKVGNYLTVNGEGAPGQPAFIDKIGALYSAAFTVKMTRKSAGLQDYAIGKLECQWWRAEDGQEFVSVSPDLWCWKLLIRTPDFVNRAELDKAVSLLLAKGKSPATREVNLETLAEGLCVQMLHIGPYEREPETIALMTNFAKNASARLHGKHHEIYISDPRRVPPELLKTILRHPVVKV